MRINLNGIGVVAITVLAVLLGACSLKGPDSGHGLKIILEDQPSTFIGKSLMNLPMSLTAASGPASVSDFNCFVVNITGLGVNARNEALLEGCSSSSNFHGAGSGVLSELVPRGFPIEVQVTSGLARTIDVYGAYPTPSECGGTEANNNNGGGGGGGGYFLGRTVEDIEEDTTVTVPISYGGASPDIVCTGQGGGGGGFYVGNVFPYGSSTSGGVNITINGNGFISTSIVYIGGTPCASQTVVSSNTITCSVPALSVGSYPISVDNQNGQISNSGAQFQVVSAGSAFVSADINTSNADFGDVSVGSNQDITITFMSTGGISATLLGSPSGFSGDFSMSSTTCSFGGSLVVGSSCTVTARFSPASPGPQNNLSVSFFTTGPNVDFYGNGI